jgi:hypothetical protein
VPPNISANGSTSDALLVATQNLLAVPRGIAIAPAHADIPISVTAPAIDVHANPRTPITSVAVPASVDIHIDIAAAALPTARPLFTRSRLSASVDLTLCRAASLTGASTRPGILTLCASLCAAGSLLLALLLRFLYESLKTVSGGTRKDRRCMLSTYAKGQYRRGGAYQ